MTRHYALFAAAAATAIATLPAAALDLTPDQHQQVAAALTLHDFTIQTLAPEAAPDDTLRVDLTLGDHPATLILTPHSIRAADYRVAEIAADGTARTVPADPIATYRGRIENDPDSRIAAGFVDGRLAAWIDTGDALWMTQSIADVLPGVDPAETAVFAADDVDMSHWFCAVEDVVPPHDDGDGLPLTPRGVSDCPLRLVTIEMTADQAYFAANTTFTQSRIETMINIVSLIYEGNFATRVELIGVRIDSGGDPWFVPGNPVDAGSLLDGFSDYIAGAPPVAGNDRDFAHLASGREFVGSTVGLAGVGTICFSTASTAVNQWTSTNLSFNATILAHEKGHNWGAGHDGSNGCGDTGLIMSPGVCSNCGPQPTQFSPCSIAEITPNLSRSCVAQFPPTLDDFGAVDDNVTIPRGTAHLIDVLLNDLVCTNGAPVQVGSISLPSSTTAAGFPITVVPGAGPGGRDMVDYEPHLAFTGNDNFSYTLVNGAQSASAFVSINVSASAAPPLCDCDCFSEYRDDSGPASAILFGPTTPVNWLNQFDVQTGGDQVLEVSIHSLLGPAGVDVRFVIWDDPNNDGDPHDAVPIATSPVVPLNQTGETSYAFPPTDVGSPGDSFFVGASYVSGQFFIATDGQPNTGNRSWHSIGSTNLASNFQTLPMDDRLVIRALAGANLADCNSNDIIDVCDVSNFIRPDVNGNGVPDECDPPPADCPCEFDDDAAQVDVFDLLAYLDAWFPGSAAADVDGNPGVDVFDLLSFLDCWFPASAGNPCP